MFRRLENSSSLFWLSAVSIALTVPFIFILKDMAGSLKTIAAQKSGLARIKKYR